MQLFWGENDLLSFCLKKTFWFSNAYKYCQIYFAYVASFLQAVLKCLNDSESFEANTKIYLAVKKKQIQGKSQLQNI